MKTPTNYFKGGIWTLVLALAALTSCQNQSRGFVLPDGDAELGRQLFTELNCVRCHSIGDIQWEGTERFDDPHVPLGGEVSQLKTYGELVTSVINPSHKISQKYLTDQKLTLTEHMSKMELYRYNEIITVEELIDLVTFLQSEYQLVVPETTYPYQGF
jgi:hypothetical protein